MSSLRLFAFAAAVFVFWAASLRSAAAAPGEWTYHGMSGLANRTSALYWEDHTNGNLYVLGGTPSTKIPNPVFDFFFLVWFFDHRPRNFLHGRENPPLVL
jgi:hypothetical protein